MSSSLRLTVSTGNSTFVYEPSYIPQYGDVRELDEVGKELSKAYNLAQRFLESQRTLAKPSSGQPAVPPA